MDLSGIIKSTEDVLYQVTLWLLLIPKTLWKVVRDPSWIPGYVRSEWAKPEEQRFDAYMPPLIFFVLVAVVPNLIANSVWPATPYTDFFTRRAVVQESTALSTEHRFFLYATSWALLPLMCSFVHQVALGQTISSTALKPTFFTQCLRVTPVSLVFMLRFALHRTAGLTSFGVSALNWGAIVIAAGWLLHSDICVARQEMRVSRAKAAVLATTGLVAYYAVVAPLTALSLWMAR